MISYLDTNIAIFLHAGDTARLTRRATEQIGVSVCQLPMAAVMSCALRVKRTREPGDRIIVANAMANNEAPLVTSDRRINEQYFNAIW